MLSRDECEKEIKQKSNEKFWNVESCNDSQRSNLRFFAQLNSFHMTWILNRPRLVFKRNETKKNTTRNSEKLSHVMILHGFFAQFNWFVW